MKTGTLMHCSVRAAWGQLIYSRCATLHNQPSWDSPVALYVLQTAEISSATRISSTCSWHLMYEVSALAIWKLKCGNCFQFKKTPSFNMPKSSGLIHPWAGWPPWLHLNDILLETLVVSQHLVVSQGTWSSPQKSNLLILCGEQMPSAHTPVPKGKSRPKRKARQVEKTQPRVKPWSSPLEASAPTLHLMNYGKNKNWCACAVWN